MGQDVDHPREGVEHLGTFGPPDPVDQAFSRFMAASGRSEHETAEIPVHRWRPPRLPHLSGLDVFWLVLAAGLVVGVVLVVSMARTSMNDVGVTASTGPAALPTPRSTAAPTEVIVQVSSSASRSVADAAAKALADHGFDAKVLKSDDYRPLNKGFYVVYTGFYPDTADGRADARKVQSKLPGSLVRDVHPR